MKKSSLLRDIEKFLKATGTAPTAFGRNAMGDSKFVSDLRRGRRCWPETETRVRKYMFNATLKVAT